MLGYFNSGVDFEALLLKKENVNRKNIIGL